MHGAGERISGCVADLMLNLRRKVRVEWGGEKNREHAIVSKTMTKQMKYVCRTKTSQPYRQHFGYLYTPDSVSALVINCSMKRQIAPALALIVYKDQGMHSRFFL